MYSLHARCTHSEVELRKCCLGQSEKSEIPYYLIICDQVCKWLATGRWFSPSTPVSSSNKTDRHDITEILLKVAPNKQTNDGTICYVESGFLGHQNDAQQFMLMNQIGIYLPFPDDLYLLGDKICHNRHDKDAIYPVHINRKPANLEQKCRKMNRLITEYRVKDKYEI